MEATQPFVQLEQALTKLTKCINTVDGFFAEDDGTRNPVDAFLKRLYKNSYRHLNGDSRQRPNDIDSQLRDVYLTLERLINHEVLISDLRQTYQSLPEGAKTTYFKSRLDKAIEGCNGMFDKVIQISSDTAGFAEDIDKAKAIATPDYIDGFVQRTDDNNERHYLESLPKTLHIASSVVLFLHDLRKPILMAEGVISGFLQEAGWWATTQSNEVTSTVEESKQQAVGGTISKTAPAVAMMYVYLHAAGWFCTQAPKTYFLSNHLTDSLHGYSGKKLANLFSKYKRKREAGKLGAADIARIQMAIELLMVKESGLAGSVSLAQDDLKKIRGEVK